jgi:hypothetical protein
VLWAGAPFFVRCARSLASGNFNMWTLIGIGVGAAFGYSVVGTLRSGLFPDSFREHGRIGVYFEAAAVIVSLTLLGQLLELQARSKTSAAIKALLGLAPKTARRLNPTAARRTYRWRRSCVGDRLRVRPGESVPVDGEVLEGVRASTSRCSPASRCRVQGGRRRGSRRYAQQQRRLVDPRNSRRPRHGAGADRADGGAGTALARADATHGRRGVVLVRARGAGRGRATLLVGACRPEPSWVTACSMRSRC